MPHKPQKVYVVLGIFLGFRGRAKNVSRDNRRFYRVSEGFQGSQGISGGVGRLLSDFSDISRSFRDLIRRS